MGCSSIGLYNNIGLAARRGGVKLGDMRSRGGGVGVYRGMRLIRWA